MASVLQHNHLVFRVETPTPPTDVDFISTWMKELVEKLGMTMLFGPHVEYLNVVGNRGATGVCILAQSSITCHVWDEPTPGLMEVDVYTCGPMKLSDAVETLARFNPSKIEYKYLDREHELKLVAEGFVEL